MGIACVIAVGCNFVPGYSDDDLAAAKNAIWSGNSSELKKLLDAHPKLANADDRGLHLLTMAVSKPEMAQLLLSKGADPNVLDEDDGSDWHASTPLITAEGPNTRSLKLLLDHGADPNLRSTYGELPLYTAVTNDYVESARLLLDHGADVHLLQPNDPKYGDNVLRASKSAAMARLLLSHGADVNQACMGETPLHAAAHDGDVERMEVLLAAGAKLEARGTSGQTPLYCAAEAGRLNAVQFLLSKGARSDVEDVIRRNCAAIAAVNGHVDVARYLVQHGVKLDVTNMWLLFGAIRNGKADGLRFLLDYGFPVNGTSAGDGATPLHVAAEAGKAGLAELLINRGADVNARDSAGQTPLFQAVLHWNRQVVVELVEHGADIDAKDDRGRTPFTFLDRYHCKEMASYLDQKRQRK